MLPSELHAGAAAVVFGVENLSSAGNRGKVTAGGELAVPRVEMGSAPAAVPHPRHRGSQERPGTARTTAPQQQQFYLSSSSSSSNYPSSQLHPARNETAKLREVLYEMVQLVNIAKKKTTKPRPGHQYRSFYNPFICKTALL